MAKKDEGKSTSENVGKPKLTDKQQRFVEDYLIDLNATQAAIRAGYSKDTAYSQGQRLLKNVEVASAIQEAQNKRSERTQITQDDVIRRLIEIADISTGKKAITETEIARTEGGVIVGTDVTKTCFEPHAANKALELLGKHLGMFKDRVDVTTGDNPLPTVINIEFGNEP